MLLNSEKIDMRDEDALSSTVYKLAEITYPRAVERELPSDMCVGSTLNDAPYVNATTYTCVWSEFANH